MLVRMRTIWMTSPARSACSSALRYDHSFARRSARNAAIMARVVWTVASAASSPDCVGRGLRRLDELFAAGDIAAHPPHRRPPGQHLGLLGGIGAVEPGRANNVLGLVEPAAQVEDEPSLAGEPGRRGVAQRAGLGVGGERGVPVPVQVLEVAVELGDEGIGPGSFGDPERLDRARRECRGGRRDRLPEARGSRGRDHRPSCPAAGRCPDRRGRSSRPRRDAGPPVRGPVRSGGGTRRRGASPGTRRGCWDPARGRRHLRPAAPGEGRDRSGRGREARWSKRAADERRERAPPAPGWGGPPGPRRRGTRTVWRPERAAGRSPRSGRAGHPGGSPRPPTEPPAASPRSPGRSRRSSPRPPRRVRAGARPRG